MSNVSESELHEIFRGYLADWLERLGYKPAPVAKKAKLAKTNLGDALKNERGRKVRIEWIIKIAAAYGEPLSIVFRDLGVRCARAEKPSEEHPINAEDSVNIREKRAANASRKRQQEPVIAEADRPVQVDTRQRHRKTTP